MEYIEREKVISELKNLPEQEHIEYMGIYLNPGNDNFKSVPTADVVEVVRCKDCKYFEVYYPIKEKDKEPIKAHYCKLYNSDRKQIDFCSYGERKDIK